VALLGLGLLMHGKRVRWPLAGNRGRSVDDLSGYFVARSVASRKQRNKTGSPNTGTGAGVKAARSSYLGDLPSLRAYYCQGNCSELASGELLATISNSKLPKPTFIARSKKLGRQCGGNNGSRMPGPSNTTGVRLLSFSWTNHFDRNVTKMTQ